MRRIVAGLMMSLDGVVEAPNRWMGPYFDEEMTQGIETGVARADAVLIGRNTYEEFAGMWPAQTGVMADFLNNSPKYVVSSTLDSLTWNNSTLLTGELAAELRRLKELPGKNIQIPGSPALVRSLLLDGLLDELNVTIAPVAVGAGRRLFDGITHRVDLTLVQSTAMRSGVLGATYRPADRSPSP